MKVILLAGGLEIRISKESQFRFKPMVSLGGMPILWHIMKLYSHYGFHGFGICAGYKQHVIKKYFADYFLHTSDITFDFTNGKNEMIVHQNTLEPWKVTVVDAEQRFGVLDIDKEGCIRDFREKTQGNSNLINYINDKVC